MAGAGYRSFSAGAVLTAAQVNTFLMEQSVMNFAGTAARGSALASVLSAGQMAHVGGGTVTVYDGSAWQQVYPNTPGLVYVAGTAFSAASAVNINNCFTTTYKNYAVLLELSADAAARSLFMRMRASGTDNSSSNYKYAGVLVQTKTSTSAVGVNGTGLTTAWAMGSLSDTEMSSHVLQIRGPQTTDHTNFQNHFFDNYKTDDGYYGTYAGAMSVSTSYDGFTVYPSLGTISGTVRVYGYRNA